MRRRSTSRPVPIRRRWILAILASFVLGSQPSSARAARSFTFLQLADTQSGDSTTKKLLDNAALHLPDFSILVGDLVGNGGDTEQWKRMKQFLSTTTPPLYTEPNTTFFPVPDGHDKDSKVKDANGYYTFHNYLTYFEVPDEPKTYYSFRHENAFFIGLNATNLYQGLGNYGEKDAQYQWLKSELRRADELRSLGQIDWLFVYYHIPGDKYISVADYGASRFDRYLEPLLHQHNVDLAFRAHQHVYERTYPIDLVNETIDYARGLAFLTVDTGGRLKRYPSITRFDHWYIAHGEHAHSYAIYKVDGRVLRVWSYRYNAGTDREELIETFTIQKNPDGTRTWDFNPSDVPATEILVPVGGMQLVAGATLSLQGRGQNLSWSYDLSGDGQSPIPIGTGASVTFTVPGGAGGNSGELTLTLQGDGGQVQQTYTVVMPDEMPPSIALAGLAVEGLVDDLSLTAVQVGGSSVAVTGGRFRGEAATASLPTTIAVIASDGRNESRRTLVLNAP